MLDPLPVEKAGLELGSWNQNVGLFREWGEGLDTQPKHT